MRTTVRLDKQTLREAKKLAAETDRTLTAVIEDALREVLARRAKPRIGTPIKLTVCGGKGLLPGIDLDDTASLLEAMEGGDGPSRR